MKTSEINLGLRVVVDSDSHYSRDGFVGEVLETGVPMKVHGYQNRVRNHGVRVKVERGLTPRQTRMRHGASLRVGAEVVVPSREIREATEADDLRYVALEARYALADQVVEVLAARNVEANADSSFRDKVQFDLLQERDVPKVTLPLHTLAMLLGVEAPEAVAR